MSDCRTLGATGEWEIVAGLKANAQVTSNAKLLSGASAHFGTRSRKQW